MIAWPDPMTDWNQNLDKVQECVAAIVRELSLEVPILLVCRDQQETESILRQYSALRGIVIFAELPLDDTWTRDYGPITLYEYPDVDSPDSPEPGMEPRPVLLDWSFNGWGLKFPARNDNMITRRLSASGYFGSTELETVPYVLEGGSIESDGQGTILSTAHCLLDYNRSPGSSLSDLEERLLQHLGADRVLWLNNGHLAGDDTDSHIDTLARFCDPQTIAYTFTDDRNDEHYDSLQAMQAELRSFRQKNGEPYNLVPLPLPSPMFAEDGHRLPATYANFLITDNSVWVPQYGVPEDTSAFTRMIGLFPGRNIRGVDCAPLIQQHGSLHCISMQIPAGVIKEGRQIHA